MNFAQSQKGKNILESYIEPSIKQSQSDIEIICKICNLAWETYFSKPSPFSNM